MAAKKLTPKQQRFVDEYLVDLNATQAAIRAGYSKKTAYRIGASLTQKSSVSIAIQKALARREKRTEITSDMVVRELARIAFSDTRKLFNEDGSMKLPHEMDDDTAAALAGVDTFEESDKGAIIGYTRKVKRWDKTRALELLGKHLGMFTDKLKLDGSLDVNLGLASLLEEVSDDEPEGSEGADD